MSTDELVKYLNSLTIESPEKYIVIAYPATEYVVKADDGNTLKSLAYDVIGPVSQAEYESVEGKISRIANKLRIKCEFGVLNGSFPPGAQVLIVSADEWLLDYSSKLNSKTSTSNTITKTQVDILSFVKIMPRMVVDIGTLASMLHVISSYEMRFELILLMIFILFSMIIRDFI